MFVRFIVCALLAAVGVAASVPLTSDVLAGSGTAVVAATGDSQSGAAAATSQHGPDGLSPPVADAVKPETPAAAATVDPKVSGAVNPAEIIVAPVKRVMPKAVAIKPSVTKAGVSKPGVTKPGVTKPALKAAAPAKDEKAATLSVKPKPKKVSENEKKGKKVSRN